MPMIQPSTAADPQTIRRREIDELRIKLLDPDGLERQDFPRLAELLDRLEAAARPECLIPMNEPVSSVDISALRTLMRDPALPIDQADRDAGVGLLCRLRQAARASAVPVYSKPARDLYRAMQVLRQDDPITYEDRGRVIDLLDYLERNLRPGMLVEPAPAAVPVDEEVELAEMPR